jgi:Abnormal spindle-like microcephaly-assoc'd, ASPM-SPD-2-Hydin
VPQTGRPAPKVVAGDALLILLETTRSVKIRTMRPFALPVIAALIFCLLPAPTWAQDLVGKPCYRSFGKVTVGKSKSYSVQLTNSGTTVLAILSKSRTGSFFSFGRLPVKINPLTSIRLTVTFTPKKAGHFTGIIKLVSTAKNSPLTINVQGTGVDSLSSQLGISPATLSFGSVTMGLSASMKATLTASNADVTISSDQSTSSEFAIQQMTLPMTIAAGKSINVRIQFTPNASGAASGKAGFISNAANSPSVEQLTGTGVAHSSHEVDLSWDAGDGTAVGYNVYRGSATAGPFTQINTALDASTNYADASVASGATYYYVTTQVNAQGAESAYSNLAKAVIPSP